MAARQWMCFVGFGLFIGSDDYKKDTKYHKMFPNYYYDYYNTPLTMYSSAQSGTYGHCLGFWD